VIIQTKIPNVIGNSNISLLIYFLIIILKFLKIEIITIVLYNYIININGIIFIFILNKFVQLNTFLIL